MNETLERWSSRRAFILAVTGAAVGLAGAVRRCAVFFLVLLATWTSSINVAEPMVATLQGWGGGRVVATAIVGVAVWGLGMLSVLSFSSLAEARALFGMNPFELVSTIPPEIFLPVGGLLIAVFAAWIMPAGAAQRALDVGTGGLRVWRALVRWVSIPLTLLVLGSSLI